MRVVIIAGAILAAFGGVACAGGAEPLDFTDGYGPYVARSTYLIVFAPQPTGGPLTWWYQFDSLQACRKDGTRGRGASPDTGRAGAMYCKEDPHLFARSVPGVGVDRSPP